MFWFKKTKIVVDAFCKDPGVFQYYPIQSAVKFFPNWWKELDSTYDAVDHKFNVTYKASTIKRCDGFISLYKKGFIIPLWTDMQYQSDSNNWNCIFADQTTTAASHNRNQYNSSVFSELVHIKIDSPWIIQEKTGIDFSWQSAFWNHIPQQNKFYIPPGVLEYKYQHTSHINMFVNSAEDSFMISAGTPMVYVVPLSEKEIEVRSHLISYEEYEKKFKHYSYHPKFNGSYKEKKRLLKKQERKCPFGFS